MDRSNAPIAIIQVTVGKQQESIYIYKNERIDEVALSFCRKYSLDEAKSVQIENIIRQEIAKNMRQNQERLVNESRESTKTSLIHQRQKSPPPDLFKPENVNHDDSSILSNKYEEWFQRIKQKQSQQELEKQRARSFSNKQSHSGVPISHKNDSSIFRKTKEMPNSTKLGQESQYVQSATQIPNYSFKQYTQKSKVANVVKKSLKIKPVNMKVKVEVAASQQHSPSATMEKQFLQRMAVNQLKKEQHILQLRKAYNKNVDQSTGQYLFQPVITKDDIYWTVKSKQEKEDLELSKELDSQRKNCNNESFKDNGSDQKDLFILKNDKLSKEQLEIIFRQMDSDSDGFISYDHIELREINENDLKLIKEVLFEMEDNNLKLNLHNFIKQCNKKGILDLEIKKQDNSNSWGYKSKTNTPVNTTKKTPPIQQPQKVKLQEQDLGQLTSKYQKLINKYKQEEQ